MQIHSVTYVIYDDDFPLLKTIQEIEGVKEKYFPYNYHQEIEHTNYMSQCVHRKLEHGTYWLQEFDKKWEAICVYGEYEKVIWGGGSVLTLVCERLLTAEEQQRVYSDLTEIYEELMSIDEDEEIL